MIIVIAGEEYDLNFLPSSVLFFLCVATKKEPKKIQGKSKCSAAFAGPAHKRTFIQPCRFFKYLTMALVYEDAALALAFRLLNYRHS